MMYDIWFYLFFWALAFLGALFVMGCVLVYLVFQPSPPRPVSVTLENIQSLLSTLKKDQEFEGLLKVFLQHFKKLPSDTDPKYWLEIIGKIASLEYFDTDRVAQLSQELQEANTEMEREIVDTIGLALKNRRKR
ncbi:hypothetical protein BKH46_02090 [Helicobacter sp. 12S02634-8]|uniref:hypothetical protein n=1 Tax=Helicobacter sp. 12S02634-8 TaxID=1476199 RepID=UPI000BA5F3E0|nr:hypothetical protein [Helicobacter sp. 12S02634-8]PAF48123.1 hypothetical protein BKH46_02090 [Helicobacter sp. 12S02634-8]